VRVGHLPACEHTRAASLYPPANVPAGKNPYLYPHPAGTRGYRVYPCPQKKLCRAEQGAGHWSARPLELDGDARAPIGPLGLGLGSGSGRRAVTAQCSGEESVGPSTQQLVAQQAKVAGSWWHGGQRRRAAAWGLGSREPRGAPRAHPAILRQGDSLCIAACGPPDQDPDALPP
jgi:hypothetical protein